MNASKTDVQIFDPNETTSTKLFSEILQELIQSVFGQINIQFVRRHQISEHDPLLVLCLNHSRIGTDIDFSVARIPTDPGHIGVCVLHMQPPHSLPITMPTETLFGEKYEKYGRLMDFAFTPESGIYKCDMNETGKKKLVSFLERYISKPTIVIQPLLWLKQLLGFKSFSRLFQDPRKGVAAILCLAGMFYFLYYLVWYESPSHDVS